MAGFIFDFNGTLFADADKQEISWRRFARDYANKELSDQEFDDHVHGQNAELTLNYLFDRQLTRTEVNDYSERKEKIYRNLCQADTDRFHLLQGAPEFLDELRRANVPMTIATASAKKNVDFFFEAFGLSSWFDMKQVIYDDGTMKSKPDPDPFLRAALKLELRPEQTVIFEDSPSGFGAAKAAGAKCIVGVVTNHNRAVLEKDSRLTLVIDDYLEIPMSKIKQLIN